MVSVTSLTADESTVIHRAARLLKLTQLSAQDQLLIEYAIGLLAVQSNCTRPRAAQLLNKMAFNS